MKVGQMMMIVIVIDLNILFNVEQYLQPTPGSRTQAQLSRATA
jgi:hypothetical protein